MPNHGEAKLLQEPSAGGNRSEALHARLALNGHSSLGAWKLAKTPLGSKSNRCSPSKSFVSFSLTFKPIVVDASIIRAVGDD